MRLRKKESDERMQQAGIVKRNDTQRTSHYPSGKLLLRPWRNSPSDAQKHVKLKYRKYLCLTAACIAISAASGISALGSMQGDGSEQMPLEGDVQKGELIPAGAYIKNLTDQNGKKIRLQARFTPKQYPLLFRAENGTFPDGTAETELLETYNDGSEQFDASQAENNYLGKNENLMLLPQNPSREQYWFAGWYLKGNQKPEKASPDDGSLISAKSRYLIANDDAEDLAKTEHTPDGKPIARALWRLNQVEAEQDGNEADLPPQQENSGQETDLWDVSHWNNQAIEKLEGLDKTAYRKLHGKTARQYGRITLNAQTSLATRYQWFRKGKGERKFIPLEETGSRLKLHDLTRENNGDQYRCEAAIGEEGEKVAYETSLTIYYLPEITGTEVYVNGEKKRWTDEKELLSM